MIGSRADTHEEVTANFSGRNPPLSPFSAHPDGGLPYRAARQQVDHYVIEIRLVAVLHDEGWYVPEIGVGGVVLAD